jgi:anti-sigma factor RsiW
MIALSATMSERSNIEDLLPWHAAGTLSRRDTERVEAALAADDKLARHYELVREELAETIHLNETLGAPSARAMHKLFAAIDAEGAPARKAARPFDLAGHMARFLIGFRLRTLAWAAAFAGLAIVVQAGIIANIYLGGQRTFQSAGVEQAAPTGPRADALIRFVPQASTGDVTKFLETYHASIVEGPLTGDLYRIRIGTAGPDLAGIIARMQAETAVVGFVGSAQ